MDAHVDSEHGADGKIFFRPFHQGILRKDMEGKTGELNGEQTQGTKHRISNQAGT
jgi:hypothetical protein